MKRKNFLQNTLLTLAGGTIINPANGWSRNFIRNQVSGNNKTAKNIIFLVSDGMSTGTLNMASLLLQRKEGRQSNWIKLYEDQKVTRALMETASASSYITDSAAASSAWGGGGNCIPARVVTVRAAPCRSPYTPRRPAAM